MLAWLARKSMKSGYQHNLNASSIADPLAIFTSDTIPKDLLITLDRTVCYGTCPVTS